MKTLAYSTETVLHRPPQEVFEFCSDLRSELQWNPKVKYVEKLTDGPVGVGTRYRARWANSGPTTVEVMAFDRPHSWETTASPGHEHPVPRHRQRRGARGPLQRPPEAPPQGPGLAGGAACPASHATPGPAAHEPHSGGARIQHDQVDVGMRPSGLRRADQQDAQPAPLNDGVDLASWWEDAPAIPPGGSPMRYKAGANQPQQVPTLVHAHRGGTGQSPRHGEVRHRPPAGRHSNPNGEGRHHTDTAD